MANIHSDGHGNLHMLAVYKFLGKTIYSITYYIKDVYPARENCSGREGVKIYVQ